MSLWNKEDSDEGAPKNLSEDDKSKTYFVDTVEASVDVNRAKGIKTPGWNKVESYTTPNGGERRRVETLVAMKRADPVETGDGTVDDDAVVADV